MMNSQAEQEHVNIEQSDVASLDNFSSMTTLRIHSNHVRTYTHGSVLLLQLGASLNETISDTAINFLLLIWLFQFSGRKLLAASGMVSMANILLNVKPNYLYVLVLLNNVHLIGSVQACNAICVVRNVEFWEIYREFNRKWRWSFLFLALLDIRYEVFSKNPDFVQIHLILSKCF